jgi:hypothetical protein
MLPWKQGILSFLPVRKLRLENLYFSPKPVLSSQLSSKQRMEIHSSLLMRLLKGYRKTSLKPSVRSGTANQKVPQAKATTLVSLSFLVTT